MATPAATPPTNGAATTPAVPATAETMPAVRASFHDTQGFALMQRVATALSKSTLVPQQYQNNMPNCLIAVDMAQRLNASILMVAQNLYVVHGRPGWSSKFLIASFNQCGRFSAIRYEWAGERGTDEWGCRAWATESRTGQRIEGPTITIALAKKEGWYTKSGSKWQTIPELMLMYRAAGWLVNTHAPEISMGLSTAEELADIELERQPGGSFGVASEDGGAEVADASASRQAALRNKYAGVKVETGEMVDAEQVARINAIVDQIEAVDPGAGIVALGCVPDGCELDALTIVQADEVEAALIAARDVATATTTPEAKGGKKRGELI